MNKIFSHSFSVALQPFFLFLFDKYSFVEACNYDGTTLVIRLDASTSVDDQNLLTNDVNAYIARTLDVTLFNAQYTNNKQIFFKTDISDNLAPFHSYMLGNYSDWFDGLSKGRGFFRVFLKRTLTLPEEIILYSEVNAFIDGTLNITSQKLIYEIRKGISERKKVGNEFVTNQYATVMLGVALETSTEAISNLVEAIFHPSIVHIQNGLFISSYNALQTVNPAAATSDPQGQAILTALKASYSAKILQMCYDSYPIEVLAKTPSIPPQNT